MQLCDKTAYVSGILYRWDPLLSMSPPSPTRALSATLFLGNSLSIAHTLTLVVLEGSHCHLDYVALFQFLVLRTRSDVSKHSTFNKISKILRNRPLWSFSWLCLCLLCNWMQVPAAFEVSCVWICPPCLWCKKEKRSEQTRQQQTHIQNILGSRWKQNALFNFFNNFLTLFWP